LYSTIAARHFENGQAVFPAPDLKEFFREPVESSAVLRVMEAQHGLLIRRAQNTYSFSHLTFHEYLTARHFANDSDPEGWFRLIRRLTDRRWREVLLLATSMVKADYLVEKMQAWLNGQIATLPAIQHLLRWTQRKQEACRGAHHPAAVRAIYLVLWHDVYQHLRYGPSWSDPRYKVHFDRRLTLTFVRDLDPDLHRVFERRFDGASDPGLTLDYSLYRALELLATREYNPYFELARERAQDVGGEGPVFYLNGEVDEQLVRARQLAGSLGLSQEFLKDVEDPCGDVSFHRLHDAMIRHRDIGVSSQLDQSDIRALLEYQYSQSVPLECLKFGRVSPATRATIEANLFLPSDSRLAITQ
jgi:hypothetical protein